MTTARLRPTAPNAGTAILVGDPGRALALAQVVLEEPKMSNHARGLWGYTSAIPEDGLTVQTTGMGGPSAVAVLDDLAKLGVQRAVRVGTCRSLTGDLAPGETVIVSRAHGLDGTSRALARTGPGPDGHDGPDPPLAGLAPDGDLRRASCASMDLDPASRSPEALRAACGDVDPDVADMQTAALARSAQLHGIEFAAVLVVEWGTRGERLESSELDRAVEEAGVLVAEALRVTNPKV